MIDTFTKDEDEDILFQDVTICKKIEKNVKFVDQIENTDQIEDIDPVIEEQEYNSDLVEETTNKIEQEEEVIVTRRNKNRKGLKRVRFNIIQDSDEDERESSTKKMK